MYGSLMNSLSQSQRNIQELQQQIASGNKYSKLSDNPSAISRSMAVQSAMNANNKYQTNTTNAITMLRYADSALNNVLNAAESIRSLIIQAGDGALNSDQLKDITAQIEANKKIMLDNLNTKVAGQYIFGGTDTSTMPFAEMPDGSIKYQGTDERIKYALSESLLGDVSFTGNDIAPENEDSYFICSHYVPLDWEWTGREEKVQITVGNRTLSVFIPEDWSDSDYNKTNTDTFNYSDDNGYRDPNEVSGISLADLASIVNSSLEEQGADMLVHAYIETDYEAGTQQLFLKSNTGEKIGITGWPDTDYMPMDATIITADMSALDWRPSGDEESLLKIAIGSSSVSNLTDKDIADMLSSIKADNPALSDDEAAAKLDEELLKSSIIRIHSDDTVETLAERINSIDGIFARPAGDGKTIVITANRQGNLPQDRLRIDEAQESLHHPSLTIKAEGNATKIFNLPEGGGTVTAKTEPRLLDHSHMDVFDVLGMETAMKSREFSPDEILTVEPGKQLHWRVVSGGRTAEIKLNAGDYTLEDLASRLKNAGAGWLEVSVSKDVNDDWGRGTRDGEPETERLVIRGFNGEQVIFLDMNENNYADKMGLSTALRTDAYDGKTGYTGTGMKCVNFPSAPCVDDNIGIPMRVQMNCGMYYDVNIRKADVVDPDTGFVDRSSVMREIVNQVNEIEGHNIMGFVQHVDSDGKNIEGSSAIYFLSGEAFTVVDMPFDDPEWNDYSGGLAAQMGIHGGVTSNLQQTTIPMKDSRLTDSGTFGDAYALAGETFREGTIRFSNLAHSVEIDVSADDTVKDVMDRLRTQAGDWLYVNYYDTHMGQADMRNSGDYPLISISSVDGSAVNVLDVKGHIAEDALGLSTGVQGRLNSNGTGKGIMDDTQFIWDITNQNFPADTLNITVAGYTHTLDLTPLRDVTADDRIMADDIVQFINSRMQDYDVQAEINSDKELMLWSPRGYSVKIDFGDNSGTDNTDTFLGVGTSARSFYRGGYDLEDSAKTRGIDTNDLYSTGIHSQNATIRSGANTMRQNGFGVINDVIAAVEAGNIDDISDKMLPRVDSFISNILSVMAENGALQARYQYNNERLVTEDAIMDEQYDDLVKIDPADAISQLMIADYAYQANLAVISRMIQPSLLDFLH